MKFNFWETANEKIMIVAHRGAFGGNIPCNVIPAFEAALKQGADVIEIDVEMSADGKLYILFESGADKYANGGGKDPTENVWTMIID